MSQSQQRDYNCIFKPFSGSHYKPRGVIQVQLTSCGNFYSNPEYIFGNWENVSVLPVNDVHAKLLDILPSFSRAWRAFSPEESLENVLKLIENVLCTFCAFELYREHVLRVCMIAVLLVANQRGYRDHTPSSRSSHSPL